MNSRIFLKDGEQCWLVNLEEISLFESCGNYTRVYFGQNKPFIYKSLNKIESRLDTSQFFRVNRQHIVNLKFIKSVDPWISGNFRLTMHDDTEIEVSRSNSSRFKNLLSL